MLNKQVKITQVNTGAVYIGNLVGYRDNKSRFCLNNVDIHSKVAGIISPKKRTYSLVSYR